PCVAQDAENGEVLMVAYMNKDSLKDTVEKGLASYWSRSRQKYWVKGESSGHTQEVIEIRTDCDKDTILLKCKQNVAACHVGYRSCFFRVLDQKEGKWNDTGEKIFDPDNVYDK
ncbi:MAG: phosphoribosyl-AMP cyclohydrolase, partial [Planctomycetes bacterium]|nr:phosphoribosyl-AMP cyclohydrolase [Planctomycetota bacterium]